CARAAHTTRDQADAAVVARECLQQQAGFAPGAGMEDVGRLGFDAHASFVSELLQRSLVIRPAGAHAYPQLEEYLAVEQRFDGAPCRAANGLDAAPTRTDHDRLLALAFHPHHRGDLGDAVGAILETFDLDRGRVR